MHSAKPIVFITRESDLCDLRHPRYCWELRISPRITVMELRRFVNETLMDGLEYSGHAERVTASVLFAAARHPRLRYQERGRTKPAWAICLEGVSNG